jgi:hypothetical protein
MVVQTGGGDCDLAAIILSKVPAALSAFSADPWLRSGLFLNSQLNQ